MGVRVLVTDDHPLVREGLETVLGLMDIDVVGTAADGDETMQRIPTLQPEVVVLDQRLPGEDGAAVTARIKASHPEVRVLILSGELNDDQLRRVIAAGADGCLLKTVRPAELAEAIRQVAAGLTVVGPELTGALFAAARTSVTASPLSERELEVLQHLARGKTNKDIAAALFVSQATVKTHVENILRKLGVADRAQAVAEGFRRGIVA
jgi:DNA-binding NarL/FixJ family response regulator